MLAVLSARRGLRYAVVDLVEVRATGKLARQPGNALEVALRHLVARERPSALTASTPALGRALKRAGQGRLPLLRWPRRPLPPPSLNFLWPEAPIFAPTKELQAAAGAAASLLLEANPLPRRYAHRAP